MNGDLTGFKRSTPVPQVAWRGMATSFSLDHLCQDRRYAPKFDEASLGPIQRKLPLTWSCPDLIRASTYQQVAGGWVDCRAKLRWRGHVIWSSPLLPRSTVCAQVWRGLVGTRQKTRIPLDFL